MKNLLFIVTSIYVINFCSWCGTCQSWCALSFQVFPSIAAKQYVLVSSIDSSFHVCTSITVEQHVINMALDIVCPFPLRREEMSVESGSITKEIWQMFCKALFVQLLSKMKELQWIWPIKGLWRTKCYGSRVGGRVTNNVSRTNRDMDS